MIVAVIGMGRVGLVVAACLAEMDHISEVNCYDIDEDKMHHLRYGEISFYEPGLAKKIEAYGNTIIDFEYSLRAAVEYADIVFVTIDQVDQLGSLIDSISEESTAVVVLKTTVPLGTTLYLSNRLDSNQYIVYNPEFMSAGTAIHDFQNPDRILIGTEWQAPIPIIQDLYLPLLGEKNKHKLLFDTTHNMEMAKLVSNTFFAMKLTFTNIMADMAQEESNIDIANVMSYMAMDQRIGNSYTFPGPGVGGSCLMKDTNILLDNFHERTSITSRLLNGIVEDNHWIENRMIKMVKDRVQSHTKVAVFGLSFKENTDDTRNSMSFKLINELAAILDNRIHVYDARYYDQRDPSLNYFKDPYKCAVATDIVVFMTDENAYRDIDLSKLQKLMRPKVPTLVDMRNMFNRKEFPFDILELGNDSTNSNR